MSHSLWILVALVGYLSSEHTLLHFRRVFWTALTCVTCFWLVEWVQSLEGAGVAWLVASAVLAASFVEDEVRKTMGLVQLEAPALVRLRASLRTPAAAGRAERVSDLVAVMTRGQGYSAGATQLYGRLRGARLRTQRALHAALAGAPRDELNYVLLAINAPAVLEVLARETLDELLGSRLPDLRTETRAVLVDALQKLGLRHRPARQARVRALLLATRGLHLTRLKSILDDGGDYHTVYKLVYHDLQAYARDDVLRHIAHQGALVAKEYAKHRDKLRTATLAQGSGGSPAPAPAGPRSLPLVPRRPVLKVLSDVDDTLFSSGGSWPAGVDARYPHKTFYPGALALFAELDRCWAEGAGAALDATASALDAVDATAGTKRATQQATAGAPGMPLPRHTLTAAPRPHGGSPVPPSATQRPRGSSPAPSVSTQRPRGGSPAPLAGPPAAPPHTAPPLPRLLIPARSSSADERYHPLSPTPSGFASPVFGVASGEPLSWQPGSPAGGAFAGDAYNAAGLLAAPGGGGGWGGYATPVAGQPAFFSSAQGAVAAAAARLAAAANLLAPYGVAAPARPMPGVTSGQVAVRNGRPHQAGSNLTFLSARPESYKGLTEAEAHKRYFAPAVARGELPSAPSMLLGSLDSGPRALLSYFRLLSPPEEVSARRDPRARSTAAALNQALAAKKLSRAREYAALYPEADLILVGDNGQGDVLCCEVLWSSLLVPEGAGTDRRKQSRGSTPARASKAANPSRLGGEGSGSRQVSVDKPEADGRADLGGESARSEGPRGLSPRAAASLEGTRPRAMVGEGVSPRATTEGEGEGEGEGSTPSSPGPPPEGETSLAATGTLEAASAPREGVSPTSLAEEAGAPPPPSGGDGPPPRIPAGSEPPVPEPSGSPGPTVPAPGARQPRPADVPAPEPPGPPAAHVPAQEPSDAPRAGLATSPSLTPAAIDLQSCGPEAFSRHSDAGREGVRTEELARNLGAPHPPAHVAGTIAADSKDDKARPRAHFSAEAGVAGVARSAADAAAADASADYRRESRLRASLVHAVAPWNATFSLLRAPGDDRTTLGARWAARDIYLHRTHVGLATRAHELGLLDDEGLFRVGVVATADFLRVWGRYAGRRAGRNLGVALKQLNADLEAASSALPVRYGLSPVPAPEAWKPGSQGAAEQLRGPATGDVLASRASRMARRASSSLEVTPDVTPRGSRAGSPTRSTAQPSAASPVTSSQLGGLEAARATAGASLTFRGRAF